MPAAFAELLPVELQLGILAHEPLGRVQGLEAELHLGHPRHGLVLVVTDAGAAHQKKVVVVLLALAGQELVEGQLLTVAAAKLSFFVFFTKLPFFSKNVIIFYAISYVSFKFLYLGFRHFI